MPARGVSSAGRQGCLSEVGQSPHLPGYVQWGTNEVPNKLGIVGQMAMGQGRAIQATLLKGGGEDCIGGAGETAPHKAEDGLRDSVQDMGGNAITVNQVVASSEPWRGPLCYGWKHRWRATGR